MLEMTTVAVKEEYDEECTNGVDTHVLDTSVIAPVVTNDENTEIVNNIHDMTDVTPAIIKEEFILPEENQEDETFQKNDQQDGPGSQQDGPGNQQDGPGSQQDGPGSRPFNSRIVARKTYVTDEFGTNTSIIKERKKRPKIIKYPKDYVMNKTSGSPRKSIQFCQDDQLLFLRNVANHQRINPNTIQQVLRTTKETPHLRRNRVDKETSTSCPTTAMPTTYQPYPTTKNVQNTSSRSTSQEKPADSLEQREDETSQFLRQLLSTGKQVDEIDLFFQNIVKTVKRLRPELQQRAKTDILNVVNKLEDEKALGLDSRNNGVVIQLHSFPNIPPTISNDSTTGYGNTSFSQKTVSSATRSLDLSNVPSTPSKLSFLPQQNIISALEQAMTRYDSHL